jgi:ABC-type glutathione transport system ATPase component
MFHIQELCDTAIWIDKGKIREIGDSDRVVGHYEDFCNNKKSYNTIRDDLPDELKQQAAEEEPALQDCRINSLAIKDMDGNEIDQLDALSDIRLEMEVEVLKDGIMGNFGFAFMKSAEEPLASFLTPDVEGLEKGPFRKGDCFTVSLVVKSLAMRVGEFYVLCGLADENGLLWYETKFSKLLTVKANKGVGPIIMKSTWQMSKKSKA